MTVTLPLVNETDMSVSANIRAEIARAGRSQRSVYIAAGINHTRWARRMHTGAWTIGELRDIAAELDIPLSRLTGDDQ